MQFLAELTTRGKRPQFLTTRYSATNRAEFHNAAETLPWRQSLFRHNDFGDDYINEICPKQLFRSYIGAHYGGAARNVDLDGRAKFFDTTTMIRIAHQFVATGRRNNAGEPLPCAQKAVPQDR